MAKEIAPEPPYDTFRIRFRRNANSLVGRYGAHVFLVGGALEDEEPRDYDVRIILPDDDFRRLYGGHPLDDKPVESCFDYQMWEWRRAYDGLKQSRLMTVRMSVPVDFQVQAESEARVYDRRPVVRLDSTPAWVFKAGRRDWSA